VRHWQIRETLEAANPATALQRRFDHLDTATSLLLSHAPFCTVLAA
jgi:hypothetical protein